MTGPKGNSEFCFPSTFKHSGRRPVIKCFVVIPSSKLEKTAKKSFALHLLAHKFTAVSRSTGCFPREFLSFDPRQVTRYLQSENVIELGGITIWFVYHAIQYLFIRQSASNV